jgi:hypothetical protein
MNVSVVSAATTAPVSALTNAGGTTATAEPTISPVAQDTVTLSAEAQQALTNTAAPSTSSTASSTTTWASDAVSKALAALNDETGSTAVSDKLSAYQLLSQMASDAKNFDPSNPANAKAVDVATAFATSAFVNQYQQINAQLVSLTPTTGSMSADDMQKQLDYLKSLSSDDLQAFVGVNNANAVASGKAPLIASASSLLANKQAQVDVTRAMETTYANPAYASALSGVADYDYYGRIAAVSKQAAATGDDATVALMQVVRSGASGAGDAWTAKAEAYFDQYGGKPASTSSDQKASQPIPTSTYTPPSEGQVRALYQAIVSLNDNQHSPTQDQLGAYMLVNQQMAAGGSTSSVALSLAVNVYSSSTVTKQVGSAFDTYENKTFTGRGNTSTTSATSELNAFNSLSASDQNIIAYVRQSVGGDGTADGYRQYLETSVSNSVELDARIAEQMMNQSAGGQPAQLHTGAAASTTADEPSTIQSADSQPTVPPQTDGEKALLILKAYTAGQATQAGSDKTVGTSGTSDNDAALLILKNSAVTQHPTPSPTEAKTASTVTQPPKEGDIATTKPSSWSSSSTGSALSFTA